MKKEIKLEDQGFENEDAHVLGDDEPVGNLPELPKIAARQRKPKIMKKRGRKTKRKTKKTKTGSKRRKKGSRKRRKTTTTSEDKGGKIRRVCRIGKEKEPKLHIRQNDDVIVVDEEDPLEKASPPPAVATKPTPSNILDDILFAQEKILGIGSKQITAPKNKTFSSGRRSVW